MSIPAAIGKTDINASGYGQGLFVIKKTIEDFHKGKLTLESEPGKGTKFSFWLPMGQLQ